MVSKNLLDPLVIAQLGNLQLKARRILDGMYSGHHANINRGHAQDFSEHRPYNPGDDLRTLDWKVFGRTDRLVVRQYEEQTNIGAVVVLDDSSSMGYSYGGRVSKLEYAKMLAAAMGYLVVSQQDAIGLISTRQQLPLQNQRGHLESFFDSLEKIQPEGIFDFNALAGLIRTFAKKRSFVLVFSDLMENPEQIISCVTSLSALRHEILVFQILDPAEITLPFQGPVLFRDLETGDELKTEPEIIRLQYQSWVKERLALLEHGFQTRHVDYTLLQTHIPFDKGMGAFLSWRGGRI